jgi:hypothetical protein
MNGWWAALFPLATGLAGVVVGALLNRSNEASRWKRETRLRCYTRFHALAWDLQQETRGFTRFVTAHTNGMGRESAEIAAETFGRIRSLHSELRDVASEAHLLAGDRVLANILAVHERLLRLFPVMRGVPGEGSPEYFEQLLEEIAQARWEFLEAARSELGIDLLPTAVRARNCSLTSTCHQDSILNSHLTQPLTKGKAERWAQRSAFALLP